MNSADGFAWWYPRSIFLLVACCYQEGAEGERRALDEGGQGHVHLVRAGGQPESPVFALKSLKNPSDPTRLGLTQQ